MKGSVSLNKIVKEIFSEMRSHLKERRLSHMKGWRKSIAERRTSVDGLLLEGISGAKRAED